MTSYVSPFTGDVIQPTDVSYQSYTLTANLQLEWPSNTSTINNPVARIMEITANSSSYSLIMPPANQVSVGQDSLIRNLGSNTFTVKDSSGGTIVSIASGKAEYIYITDNTTIAGIWGIINLGTGTSAPDAATLAGLGLLAQSTTLNQSHPAQTINNGDTFASTDRAQTKVWAGGVGSATLPLASTLGNNWFTLIKNNGTGTFTVITTSPDVIDLQPQFQFQPNESAFIICDGTQYLTIGYGQSSTFLFSALVKAVTSGTYTLTTQEAASIIQEYVGSLTGNVTIVYPPVVALYIVSNQTTANSHSLSITTGVSGGANVSIPAGQQASVICDGSNFFNANTVQAGGSATQLNDGSVTSPSLSFINEVSTGIYRPGLGNFGITVLGTEALNIDTTGIQVTGNVQATGTGNFKGGISGGNFN